MPLSKDQMREYQRRRRLEFEHCMGCGKAAAEKYYRVNPLCPGLKLRAGCADALTAAAAANPASTPMCEICGINPPTTDGRLDLYGDKFPELAAAVRVGSLKLCKDCRMVAVALNAAMHSDNAAILPRRIAIAIDLVTQLADPDSDKYCADRYCADCVALGCHLSLMPGVDWYARDNPCQ